jgi:hypothetical protein
MFQCCQHHIKEMNNLFDSEKWFNVDYSELELCLLKPSYRIPGYKNVVRTYFMSVPRTTSIVPTNDISKVKSKFFGSNCRKNPDEVLELLMFSTLDDWCYESVMYHENRTHDGHDVLIVDFFFKDVESSSMFHGCLMSDLTPT